ncbi:MAG: hypothetical protein HKL84_08285 [Acidimicrobiaceae bacterium]|nr:hypothetical protein [Acidimicrobiaceae bacterium]
MAFSQVIDLVVTVLLLVALSFAGILISEMRSLTTSLDDELGKLTVEIRGLISEVSGLVDDAELDVNKFETLLEAANTVTSSMGNASKLAYNAVASPVVKVKALRAGVAKLVMVFKSQSKQSKGGR